MTTPPTSDPNGAAIPWEFVPVSERTLPVVPARQAAQQGLAQLWRSFRRNDTAEDVTLEQQVELRSLRRWQTRRVAPLLGWTAASEALDVALRAWVRSDNSDHQVIFVIAPPFGGHAEVAGAWAQQRGHTEIQRPTAEQIMARDSSWLAALPSPDAFWVFPALERAFLRHTNGLHLVREFLDQAFSGAIGRGVIGCDSWAWAFLQHVWHGRRPLTLTAQAFDQAGLAILLPHLAQSGRRDPILFRQADNGLPIMPPPDATTETPTEFSNYLPQLAGFSRGIPGVALAVWRASLRIEPDETADEDVAEGDRLLAQQTIWVAPWDKVSLPQLPADANAGVAFVLHTLLLHNGLPFDLLHQLLPLASSQAMETLYQLEEEGLVRKQQDLWQVSPTGYPAAREFLQTHGYLIDAF